MTDIRLILTILTVIWMLFASAVVYYGNKKALATLMVAWLVLFIAWQCVSL
jgi:hypothetical protein